MTNKEHIAEIIKQAEKDLTKCFSILVSLKSGNFNGLENFQPMLADTLYKLTNTYNDARAIYKKSLQKQQNSEKAKEWKAYKEAIKILMKIGQNMGDIFAWYFYSNNLNLLHALYELPANDIGRLRLAQAPGHVQNFSIRNKAGVFSVLHSLPPIKKSAPRS